MGLAVILACSGGCIIEDENDGRHWHHHVLAAEVPGHVHGPDCGHVLIEGRWCEK